MFLIRAKECMFVLNRLLPFETIRVTTGFAMLKAFFLKSKRIHMNILN